VFAHNGYLGFPAAKKIQLPKNWTEMLNTSLASAG
jgi:hypothetical protein